MKLGVNLPEADVSYLDALYARGAFRSRSAALHAAVDLMRQRSLADEYADYYREMHTPDHDDEAQAWESTVSDGLDER